MGLTGASGLLGSAFAARWLAAGWSLRSLDRQRPCPGAESLRGDIRDPAIVERFLDGLDVVVHLAGSMGADIETLRQVNWEASRVLFSAASRLRLRRVVFASTTAIYPAGEFSDLEEYDPPAPLDPYPRSKWEAERCGREQLGEALTCLRLVTCYRDGPCPLVDTLTSLAGLGTWPLIAGLDPRIDFLHVDDAAQGILAALDPSSPGGTYHLAGDPIRYTELVRAIHGHLGHSPHFRSSSDPAELRGEFPAQVLAAASQERTVQTGRARRQLGFSPLRSAAASFRAALAGFAR